MSARSILELFADESKWTQRSSARDAYGKRAGPDVVAVKWALDGAIERCRPTQPGLDRAMDCFFGAIGQQKTGTGWRQIEKWNDDPARKFSEILEMAKLLDAAEARHHE